MPTFEHVYGLMWIGNRDNFLCICSFKRFQSLREFFCFCLFLNKTKINNNKDMKMKFVGIIPAGKKAYILIGHDIIICVAHSKITPSGEDFC